MDTEMMEIMVGDWLDDEGAEYLVLVGKPYHDAELDCWCQDAEDERCTYILTEHNGFIVLNYVGEQ